MTGRLDLPTELALTWDDFVREWHLGEDGSGLACDPRLVARALTALHRLWPEEISRIASDTGLGLGVIAAAVELGLMLEVSETAKSFNNVLSRLKSGERSAYSELVLVASLIRLGYSAEFEPPLGNSLLDAVCSVDGSAIYFEVVIPNRSDASEAQQAVMKRLSETVRNSVSKCRVEIEVLEPVVEEDIIAVVRAVRSARSSDWVIVESKIRLRRIDAGMPLPRLFDVDGVQVVIGGEKDAQGESTSVVMRWEASDERAKRIFNREYHHFSPQFGNMLVVHTSAVTDGWKSWPLLMIRLLQPKRNRNVSAVAFFDQGLLGPPEAIRRRWRIVVNPFAHVLIPETLLADIESLDESNHYNSPREPRLTAA